MTVHYCPHCAQPVTGVAQEWPRETRVSIHPPASEPTWATVSHANRTGHVIDYTHGADRQQLVSVRLDDIPGSPGWVAHYPPFWLTRLQGDTDGE